MQMHGTADYAVVTLHDLSHVTVEITCNPLAMHLLANPLAMHLHGNLLKKGQ